MPEPKPDPSPLSFRSGHALLSGGRLPAAWGTDHTS